MAILELYSESNFSPAPVSTEHIACSPAIDLSATVHDQTTLFIRRRLGESVVKHAERGKTIEAIRWKADGKRHICHVESRLLND